MEPTAARDVVGSDTLTPNPPHEDGKSTHHTLDATRNAGYVFKDHPSSINTVKSQSKSKQSINQSGNANARDFRPIKSSI